MDPKTKRILLASGGLFFYLLGCMASFDLGASHACDVSGGTLLRTYECVMPASMKYCIIDDNTYGVNPGWQYNQNPDFNISESMK